MVNDDTSPAPPPHQRSHLTTRSVRPRPFSSQLQSSKQQLSPQQHQHPPPQQRHRRRRRVVENNAKQRNCRNCCWITLSLIFLYGMSLQWGMYLAITTSSSSSSNRRRHGGGGGGSSSGGSGSSGSVMEEPWAVMWEMYNQPLEGDVGLTALERRQEYRKRKRQWEPEIPQFPPPTHLKLSKPIINVGFPKAGTSSIFSFFHCNGLIGQHWFCCESQTNPSATDHQYLMSRCILNNLIANHENEQQQQLQQQNNDNNNTHRHHHILEGCGDYDFYTEINGPRMFVETNFRTLHDDGRLANRRQSLEHPRMILPQHHYLPQIHEQYPNATFILNTRPVVEWVESVLAWGGGKKSSTLKEELIHEFWFQDRFRNFTTFVGPHKEWLFQRYNNRSTATKTRIQHSHRQHNYPPPRQESYRNFSATERAEREHGSKDHGEDNYAKEDDTFRIQKEDAYFYNTTLTYIMEYHSQYVRNFVKEHPSHTLIEIDITHNDTGRILANAFGLNETCWGHKNANTRKAKKRGNGRPGPKMIKHRPSDDHHHRYPQDISGGRRKRRHKKSGPRRRSGPRGARSGMGGGGNSSRGDMRNELQDDEDEDEEEELDYYRDEGALDDDHDAFTEKYKELRAKRKELLKTIHKGNNAGKRKDSRHHKGATAK